MDLKWTVETVKRILDRQLAGQTSLTPFMNIKEGYSKRVAFDMMDSLEQKIDKITVMMGKLVTEMKDRIHSFNHEFNSPIEVEDRQDTTTNREDFRIGLVQITHTEEDKSMDTIIEVGHDMILIIQIVMYII